jgi:hypothetical protein
MRMAKLRRMLQTLQEKIDSEFLTIVFVVARNLLLIIAINHFLACMWFLISKSSDGWLIDSPYESMDYGEQYLVCLHWSLAQFTPGASPIQPVSLVERVIAVLVLALGLVMATCFMSSITSTLSAVWVNGNYKNTQSLLLRKFLHQEAISRELRTRITRYIDCILELRQKKVHHSKVHYLQILSGPLAQEMQRQIHEPLLLTYSAFEALKDGYPAALVTICGQALTQETFGRNDLVFRRGARSKDMYFVSNGALVYRFKRFGGSHQLARLEAKQWCADHTLWTEWSHVGTMKGLSHAEVTKLEASKFHLIVSGLPRLGYTILRDHAVANLEKIWQLQSFDASALTDIPIGDKGFLVEKSDDDNPLERDLNEAETADMDLIEFDDDKDDFDSKHVLQDRPRLSKSMTFRDEDGALKIKRLSLGVHTTETDTAEPTPTSSSQELLDSPKGKAIGNKKRHPEKDEAWGQ